jgi:hypothetical protein
MLNDPDAEDALLQAISDLRGAMDQMFDEQMMRLVDLPASSSHPSVMLAMAESPADRLSAQRLPVGESTVASRSRLKGHPHDRRKMAALHARRHSSSSVDPGKLSDPLHARGDDPAQRLDALAKHLDDRLRRARESVVERPKPDVDE